MEGHTAMISCVRAVGSRVVPAAVVAFVIALADASAQSTAPQPSKPPSTTPPAGQPPAAASTQSAKIPADQLDSLVAPVALFPDPLLAQTLAASTYPLEIIQLQQWLAKNPALKEKALADAVAKQGWDA